jgi:4-amino-4-deoxy-L-arabinose transferase-like glycosyltransferase
MLLGRRAAVVAGFVWISTYFLVDEFRKAIADPYLASFTLLCAWAWVRTDVTARAGAVAGRATGVVVVVLIFWLALALGVLAKGPFILLHVAIIVLSYQVTQGRWPARYHAHALGLALFLLVALPWPAYILTKVPNVGQLWTAESLGEAAGARNPRPWFHYLSGLLQTSLPWTPILVVGMAWPFTGPRRRRQVAFAILWLLMTVFVFSLAAQKKNAYLLPAMAAQTLVIAAPLSAWLKHRKPQLAFISTAIVLTIGVHVAVTWHGAARDNRRSPVPFVRQLEAITADRPLIALGFVNEEVLFYLRRPTEFVDQLSQLPPDYTGFVLVNDGVLDALERSRPSERLATLQRTQKQDRMYLLRVTASLARTGPDERTGTPDHRAGG